MFRAIGTREREREKKKCQHPFGINDGLHEVQLLSLFNLHSYIKL